jgi:hypothetical protein
VSGLRFVTLSRLVLDLQARVRVTRADDDPALRTLLTDATSDLRTRAAALAVLHSGVDVVDGAPALVNVGALALAAVPRLTVHSVRPGAAGLVHATDLHSLPGEPPRLLRRAWLLEVRRPEAGERLFGETVSLGGYDLDGRTYLVGLDYPDGVHVAGWRPAWGERDLEVALPHGESSPLIEDVDAHHEWAREAARFAVVLGLLLDAEGAPLRREDDRRDTAGKPAARGPGRPGEYVVRHLYLDDSPANRAGGSGGVSVPGTLAAQVVVRGHLKRQPCGPGGRERRWIWVGGYEARRWVAPRPARVVVH